MYLNTRSTVLLGMACSLASQVALKSRGIDKLLDEAREDNKDNDNAYMGRKCKAITTPGLYCIVPRF